MEPVLGLREFAVRGIGSSEICLDLRVFLQRHQRLQNEQCFVAHVMTQVQNGGGLQSRNVLRVKPEHLLKSLQRAIVIPLGGVRFGERVIEEDRSGLTPYGTCQIDKGGIKL